MEWNQKDKFSDIKNILLFVFENKHSNFYRDRFNKFNFDPLRDFQSIKDIVKIPFLSKKDISISDPFNLLFLDEKNVGFISMTSGTTGFPTFIFREKELIKVERGIDLDKILMLHSTNMALRLHFNHSRVMGGLMAVGDIHNLPLSVRIISSLNIKTIHTTPLLAIISKNYLEKDYKALESIKFFILIGEKLSLSKKKFLQKIYPGVNLFFSEGGLAELGQIYFQCFHLAKREDAIYFHFFPNFYFEIINPENGENVPFGELGELVVTSFRDRATPMIRYRTGDLVRLVENKCACGNKEPLLELLGRINQDVVRVGGFIITKEIFANIFRKMNDFIDSDKFEIYVAEKFIDEIMKIEIKIKLSLKNEFLLENDVRNIIHKEILKCPISSNYTFEKAIESGIFEDIQIEFGTIPESSKTGKIFLS